MRRFQRSRYAAMLGLAGAAALTACGGGSDGTTPTPVTPVAATVAIAGTAAKGPMAKADVAVHAANADGSTSPADEVSGLAQPLPAGFAMRSMLVPDSTASITVSASGPATSTRWTWPL